MQKIDAYILAGGRSRRFGEDKARFAIDGKAMVLHVADAVRGLVGAVHVVADVAGKYDDLGLRTIADAQPGRGPLGGLVAALDDAEGDAILLLACDMPFACGPWVMQLLGVAVEHAACDAIAFANDRWQPMPAVFRPSVLKHVACANSMQQLLESAYTFRLPTPMDWPDSGSINRKADLPATVPRKSGSG